MSDTSTRMPKHMKKVDEGESPETSTQEQVGRSAALMSVLVVVSRLTGFLRTWGQAYAIGVTVMASCYSIANNLPNQLYELVAAGMLTTAFLPVYMTVKKRAGTEGASAYTSNLVSIVLLVMGAVAVLGFVFAAQMVYTQSFSATDAFDFDLTVYFFRFFVIEVVLYALSSIFSGVLNAERDYFWGQAAPIFNNFVTTASFLVYAALAESNPQLALLVLALGNPLGVAAQVLLQIPPMLRHGIKLRFRVDLRDPLLRETLKIGVPSIAVVVASFVTTSVQSSSALSVTATGASITYYSRLWYTLPYSILTVPITTAMFTELSDSWAKGDRESFTRGISSGTDLPSRVRRLHVPAEGRLRHAQDDAVRRCQRDRCRGSGGCPPHAHARLWPRLRCLLVHALLCDPLRGHVCQPPSHARQHRAWLHPRLRGARRPARPCGSRRGSPPAQPPQLLAR